MVLPPSLKGFVQLTNGGGVSEEVRSRKLTEMFHPIEVRWTLNIILYRLHYHSLSDRPEPDYTIPYRVEATGQGVFRQTYSNSGWRT